MAQEAGTYEQAVRAARLQKVLDEHGRPHDPAIIPEPGDIDRFVGVQRGRSDEPWYYFGDTLDMVCIMLVEIDGDWTPEEIIDLDNGDRYPVEIIIRPVTSQCKRGDIDHGLDTESSASRQHFIDTGRYLTLTERAEDLLDGLHPTVYEQVTRAAETQYERGATALAEELPAECIALIEEVTMRKWDDEQEGH